MLNLERRLLVYVSVSFVVLTFVALMLLPLGLPYFEHIIGYWWAEPYFKFAIGQEQKILWYKKAFFSGIFVLWVAASAWISYKLLSRRAKNGPLLIWAYVLFCFTVITSQFLVLGDWKTHAYVNTIDMSDGCPAILRIADRIDTAENFMKDMVKYAGVDGKLRGTIGTKGPAFILMFYYPDQVGKAFLQTAGFDSTNLGARAAALACIFTFLIGLFLVPSFYLLRMLFSENVARVGTIVLAMNPFAAHGFVHMAALGHHILLPVSALCLTILMFGLKRENWWMIAGSIIIAILPCFAVMESLALAGLLVIITLVYFYKKGTLKKIGRNVWLALVASGFALLAVAWLIFKVAFGLDIAAHFYQHFIILHVGVEYRKLFLERGPIVYLMALFTNVFCFLFFLGMPLAVQLYYSIRARKNLNALSWGLMAGTILFTVLLDLTGISTETSRLWAFLAPPFYIAALAEFGQITDNKKLTALGIGIFLIEGIQILIERNVHYTI